MTSSNEPLEILSLGAGVQSSTVLLMSCHGDLPKLDHAIFADTQWEPKAVYQWFAQVIRPACEKAGIQLHVVTKGNIKHDALKSQVRGKAEKGEDGKVKQRWASMPYRTRNQDGSFGMIRRQCTSEYKIAPIEKKVRELLGLSRGQRWPMSLAAHQWMGISYDEMQRMKTSLRPAVEFWYPLVERRLTRGHCLEWLERKGYPKAPRSSCIGCPFHSNAEWRRLTDEEWAEAVEFDEQIRTMGGMRGEAFLHRDAIPLSEVDLTTAEEHGQLSLLDECDGYCGI